jgi:hypothetical protein
MPVANDAVTHEEFAAVVCQLVRTRAAQKSAESQQSSEAAAPQFDSMLRQVKTSQVVA